MSSPFSAAWLAGDPAARSLLPGSGDAALRLEAVRRAARRPVAPALLEVLSRQQAALSPSPARRRHLELLARPGAAVVTTGQQVGLFLGPLYTYYKAATAVAVARAVSEESGVPTVPLFWLQTEDHDFPEIDHCLVPAPGGRAQRLTVTDGGTDGGGGERDPAARVSIAHRRLGPDVADRVADLEAALGSQPYAAEFLPLLAAAYRPGRPIAAAFAEVLGALFADEGLLVFNPREEAVAGLLSPLYGRALERATVASEALRERGRALTQAGFDEQVHPRPGSPLFFVHTPDAAGPRFRLDPLDPAGERFLLAGGSGQVSRAEVARLARDEPLRCSTSALLRPLAEAALLPSVAYVGGPGELNYFAQLAPLYEVFDLSPQLFVPRMRLRCTDARTAAALAALGLSPADTERPADDLVAELSRRGAGLPLNVKQDLVAGFHAQLEALAPTALALDPALARALRRTAASVDRAAGRFASRLTRAAFERDVLSRERIERALGMLQPGGQPQERVYGLPWFACRFGLQAWKSAVAGACVPFDGSLREISP